MARLLYALICSDVIVDRETGATSFIRSIEHAVVQNLPATLPPLYVGSMWELEDAEPFTVALQLTHPDGKIETLGVQEVASPGTMLHKLNFQLPGLAVTQEGRHVLSVTTKRGSEWTSQAELPVFIFRPSQETPQA
ncbi:hypothetical protein [Salidesulfovibrio onnuriiensis]|uniref:hypothetical protein n=1 Tax=Salidesulfovibrio onnuriiensis TaxID=2583823 RepID=UPI0011C83265|nr:hypothetical protein [Salidesulfovibrio onnuriiensis]